VGLELGVRADEIDVVARTVTLSDHRVLPYDALVLATGSRARTLPGFEGDRVHVLRSLADAERIAPRLVAGTHLAILGAGFVGCEVAAVAAERGLSVTVLEPAPTVLGRVLAPEIGQAMQAIHAEHGVDLRTGVMVTSMRETADGLELVTDSGEVVACDELLVGVGSIPNAELAEAAGIEVDGGIVTDAFGRTSAPDVYAIGDVASRFHPGHGRHLRVEHHDTAMRHGQHLARTLTGEPAAFTEEPYFWSHQYDHQVQCVGGHYVGDGEAVVRGSVEDRSFSAFVLEDGRIRALVALDRPRDLLQTRKLLAVPHEVTAEQLADETFDLKSLMPQRERPPREQRARRERATA
jgi:3-phenylpropionate/trans-cinnamate dioxygenase ferredoxin reductase subunit